MKDSEENKQLTLCLLTWLRGEEEAEPEGGHGKSEPLGVCVFGGGEAESITEQRGRGVWLLREMQQYYLSAFAHPAEAGTGSNLTSLGASQ